MKVVIDLDVSDAERAALARDHGDRSWSWDDVRQWARNSLESFLADFREGELGASVTHDNDSRSATSVPPGKTPCLQLTIPHDRFRPVGDDVSAAA